LFVEPSNYGTDESNPYSKLYEQRIIFIGTPTDDAVANDIAAQLLLYLESGHPGHPVSLYINSPGGSLTAMAAIYDTMQYIRPPIQTICMGHACFRGRTSRKPTRRDPAELFTPGAMTTRRRKKTGRRGFMG
jgi:ATP-dependent Clp endopeptidase proteolytic subunit ClpP